MGVASQEEILYIIGMRQENIKANNKISQLELEKVLKIAKNFAMSEAIFEPAGEDFGDLSFILKDPTGWGRTEGCPLHVPLFYNENQSYKKPEKKKNKDPELKYKALSEILHAGRTNNEGILSAVNQFMKTKSVLMYKKDGAIIAFEGNAKGTKRYAQKQMYRVAQHARVASKLKPYTMFLTLTQKVEVGKQDIVKQWQSFGEHVKLLCDLLQRKYSIEYERVAESTNNGYRHEHIVLHFDQEPCKMFTRKFKNSEEVFGGELRAFIKSHWTLGMSKLEISSKRSPIGYLLKYIGKCAYSDFSKILKQEAPLSKEQRKQLLTIFCSIIAKVRQCNMSEISKDLLEEEEEEKSVARSGLKNSNSSVASVASEASGLDTLSINFKLPCQNLLRFFNYNKFKDETKGEIEDFDALPQSIKEKTYKKGKCNGCSGCIITHILNELQNHNDEWFHPTKEHANRKEVDTDKTAKNIKEKMEQGNYNPDELVEDLANLAWNKETSEENNICSISNNVVECRKASKLETHYFDNLDERAQPFVALSQHLSYTAFVEIPQAPIDWEDVRDNWFDEEIFMQSGHWQGATESELHKVI